MDSDKQVIPRFGGGKKLVMKEIAKDGAGAAVHQKDNEKGIFMKNQQETDKRKQLDYKGMKRNGLR